MKRCPACAYPNPDAAGACGICGRSLAGVATLQERKAESGPNLMPAYAAVLAGCAILFLLLRPLLNRPPAVPGPAEADESHPWDGALYALDKLSGLAYLPEADKRSALRLLFSPDEKTAFAAARTAGAWARSERDPALAAVWVEKLLEAAVSAPPAARRQAALEAGMALALGRPPGTRPGLAAAAAGSLAAEADPGLRGAGLMLSALAGLRDYVPQMKRELLYDPVRVSKLYAACALSRLGEPEGYEHLARTVLAGDSELAPEALSCLAYSASPEAERLLGAAAAGPGGAIAESAKMALMLRRQLGIIKK